MRKLSVVVTLMLAMIVAVPVQAATSTGVFVSDNSSLANFQSWAGAIHSAFIAFGWVQTSDTGQTVPSAAVAVPSSTYLYVIYKANDSLASTQPIYVKFAYGFSSTSPRIQFTVGLGSNGSGTITSPMNGQPWEITEDETNHGSTTYNCWFSGDAGDFRMYLWQSTTTNLATFFDISRSVNSSGVATADYFTSLSASAGFTGGTNGRPLQTEESNSYNYTAQEGWWGVGCPSAGTGFDNGTVAALPIFPLIGKVGNPLLDVMGACASDVSDGATVTVASLYGGTHTYIAVNRATNGAANNFSAALTKGGTGTQTTMAFLMRYE